MDNPAEPRFIADVMVGRLARWLRILGFDVLYSNAYDDDEVIRCADTEDRIILTRDTGLVRRVLPVKVLFIKNDDYESQVCQVLERFPDSQQSLFSRCPECNALLEPVDKEEVFLRVPPFIYLTHTEFAKCPGCDRVYWRGSHAEKIARKLNSLCSGAKDLYS